jgi:crossover junction endodeoxyribonuclease RuvC
MILLNNSKRTTKSKKSSPMLSNIVLGIDPGYGRMGIAVVDSNNRNPILLHSECFETSSELAHQERLALIAEKIKSLIEEYDPKEIGVETLLFSKNQKTALKVSEARGVILAEAARANLKVNEINPNTVKLAVTGYGKSDKKQVIDMVERLVKIDHKIKHDDEYDAIAIAIAAAVSGNLST